ncbi:MAG: presqualene diphosphate synthase HpnD [Candidatus Rokubacteria bacterium]|nr:presqualene diphosphate synthase HpnD [Candidatus Rokubacteria bacterium]
MNPADLVARLTRRSRSSFFYGFLALSKPRRAALYAVYAFCRTVDDIADTPGAVGDPAVARAALAGWRQEVARCYEGGGPEHPIAQRLAAAVRDYAIPRHAVEAIVDGVEMDTTGTAYETAEELERYCYRVASAVGLCAIEIFGYRDPRAREYAVNLGKALQWTNIMRDVGEDARNGRVYLPRADLREFGVTEADLRAGRSSDAFVRLMARQAERARGFYRAAWAALPPVDARSLVAAEIMGRIYFALLGRIEAARFQVFGRRIAVPTGRKVAIAVRCWARAHFPGAATRVGAAA